MCRPEGPGAVHDAPRAVGRLTGDAPACFRDFMGYHGISRAVKEMAGFRMRPGDPGVSAIQQQLGLRNGSDCAGVLAPRGRTRKWRRRRPYRDGGASTCASWPVSRVLYGGLVTRVTAIPLKGARCRTPPATYPDGWPGNLPELIAPRRPYSVLLPVGFTVPVPLPVPRWALTPPFHPYPSPRERLAGRFAFCGTFPGVAPAGR